MTSQKRVWQKAQKKELSGTRGKGYIVYVVQECEFYAPEEELEEEKKGKGERKTAKWHEREDALCADRRSP